MTSTDLDIMRALNDLDNKLTGIITAGHAALTATITTITETHHQAQIAQEKRNATFATTDRVEGIASRVHELSNLVTTHTLKIQLLDNDCRELNITTEADRLHNQQERDASSSSTITYIITALMLLLTNLLTFVLAHAH